MKLGILKQALLLLCILCLPVVAQTPEDACKDKAKSFNNWFACRIDQIVAVRISQRNIVNQTESPSASSNSTALVDTTSAADLIGVALNLAALATNSSEEESSSFSTTVNLYSLKAAASGRDPLDPGFYFANRNSRKLSFTVGFDYPEGMEANPAARATVFGIKFLPVNERDASNPENLAILDLKKRMGTAGSAIARTAKRTRNYFLVLATSQGKVATGMDPVDFFSDVLANESSDKWEKEIYPLIGEKELAEVDEIISDEIDAIAGLKEQAIAAAEEIRTANQISFQYLTKQRREDMPDEHMFQANLDIGITGRGNVTLNAAFDYVDNKMTEDNKGGRFAAAFQYKITRDELEGRMPWLLTVASDGSWMTNEIPMYRAQAKITIPIVAGIDLPLSVTVANRTELIKEADVKGKFGFTFDVARIASAFAGALFSR